MKTRRRILYILLPVVSIVLLGALLAGSACTPAGTIPRSCEQWYEKGKLDGYNDGYSKGKTDGQAAGYNDGYYKGLQDGKALCPQCPTCPTCPTCHEYQYQYYPYQYYPPYWYWDYPCPSCPTP
ncbi:MAG: hypothetical protein A2Z75_07790 [Chloroflexi bacterium RBG_13_50_10]|nr:MAG: hypothetical protein A2Z75_07790 [Chloroflexi bacterium RBG_13_50_10]